MYFLFVSHQSEQPFLRYGQNSVWPWKNTSKIFKKICQNNSYIQNFSKIESGNNDAATYCGDLVSGCYFIAQTSKVLLIDSTAETFDKVMERYSSTIPQTQISYVPNI